MDASVPAEDGIGGSLAVLELGQVSYGTALGYQQVLVQARRQGEIPDTLIMLEHPDVITFGRSGHDENLIADQSTLDRLGVEVHWTDRGGDATYHGPGQIVGYPIIDLNRYGRDLHLFLRKIEDSIVSTLAAFGVEARPEPGLTGVWVGDEKIAAIGIKVSRWVSSHGFSLNVRPNLERYALIVPCGISGRGVTSLERLLANAPPADEVRALAASAFCRSFGYEDVMGDTAVARKILALD